MGSLVRGSLLRTLPHPPRGQLHHLPPRIERALARVDRALTGHGPLRAELRRLPRAGTRDGAGGRAAIAPRRARRSERLGNGGAVLQVLVRLLDLRSGRIGRPGPGGAWEYLPASVLDEYAFGTPVAWERSPVRTERALRDLQAAGWLRVTERPRAEAGAWRSRAAVRVMTPTGLRALGLQATGAAVQEQIAATRIGAAQARRRQHAPPPRGLVVIGEVLGAGDTPVPAATPAPSGADPPSTGPPGPRDADIARRHLEEIAETLRQRR